MIVRMLRHLAKTGQCRTHFDEGHGHLVAKGQCRMHFDHGHGHLVKTGQCRMHFDEGRDQNVQRLRRAIKVAYRLITK